MTKTIFIATVSLILLVVGAWYVGNEQQSGSLTTDLSDVTFVSCTYTEDGDESYIVQYPSNWENQSCWHFVSPDDRGRVKDFIDVVQFEIRPYDYTVPEDEYTGAMNNQKTDLENIRANVEADDFTVDGMPAYRWPDKESDGRIVRFIKDNHTFDIRKGTATSDAIFDEFVASFRFVD